MANTNTTTNNNNEHWKLVYILGTLFHHPCWQQVAANPTSHVLELGVDLNIRSWPNLWQETHGRNGHTETRHTRTGCRLLTPGPTYTCPLCPSHFPCPELRKCPSREGEGGLSSTLHVEICKQQVEALQNPIQCHPLPICFLTSDLTNQTKEPKNSDCETSWLV